MFHEDRRDRWKPVLVALALTVGAALIAVVASVAQSSRHRPQVASPSVPAVAVTVLQAPPGDRPLLWFRETDSGLPFVMRATDWTGRVVGSVSVGCAPCGVLASPDGQRLLIGYQRLPGMTPDSDRVYDPKGRLVSRVDGFESQWSDDSRHLCTVRNQTAGSAVPASAPPAELDLIDTSDGSSRSVAPLNSSAGPGQQAVWSIVSCSSSTDRAVAVLSEAGVRALRVVRLSTGHTLLARDDVAAGEPCGCPVSSLVVSADGTVAAENLTGSAVARQLDLSSGRETPGAPSWEEGRGPVTSLSWDGRMAVTPTGVYEYPSGRPLWQAKLPAYMLPLSSEPYSDGVLLSVWASSAAAGRPVIVRSDGSAANLPSTYLSQPPLPF